jgi:hypothetical protein
MTYRSRFALLATALLLSAAPCLAQLQTAAGMCAGYADAAKWPADHDAVRAAPANHRVLYETDQIRVLEVTVAPGERENLHHHRWPSVMVVDSRPPYTNYDKDGRVTPPALQGTIEMPVTARLPAQPDHAIENTDAARSFHAIRVEFKTLCQPE